MKRLSAWLIVVATLVSLTASPPGLSAKGRRGAAVRVLKSDGLEVPGELISVGSDSLVLRRGGADLTIPRAKIHSAQTLRRSKRGTGTIVGFLAGATAGALWGVARGPDPIHGHPALIAGSVAGGLGALIGQLVSRGGGVDSTLVFAGTSSPAADENWDRLRAYSRESRMR
jgi:hypothetical protein